MLYSLLTQAPGAEAPRQGRLCQHQAQQEASECVVWCRASGMLNNPTTTQNLVWRDFNGIAFTHTPMVCNHANDI